MSKDVKFFCACNHHVNGLTYVADECPRCYGKGYYFDIYFEGRKPVLAEGSIKLQQELLKILIQEKGENVFHPEWGNDINERIIGTKNLNITRTKIEFLLKQTIEYLKAIQLSENYIWDNMNENEIIDQISSIEVIPLDKTGYYVKIQLSNSAGEIIGQTFTL